MALVGSAHVIVRAVTNRVDRDIRDGFKGVEKTGRRAGESLGQAFSRGYQKNVNANVFTRTAIAIRTMVPAADQARRAFSGLVRLGLVLGPVISGLLGGIAALVNGLVGLAGSAAGALGSLAALGNVLFALISSMIVAKLALSGVGAAISAINRGGGGGGGAAGVASLRAIQDAERSLALVIERNRENLIDANNAVRRAQLDLNDALKEGREEIQQLGFDAEDAALAEQRAALALEEARLQLAGVQDLPPNSRARQEAELAYQEAELNLRRARDSSADLNKGQDRLARTGVAGTQVVINATNALAEAEANKSKTVRDAARAEADAQEAIARARESAATAGGGGGPDPYEGLNDAQRKFVDFIVGLKREFDILEEIAAASFLPRLQFAIELLMKEAYPIVAEGIGIVGMALGEATISLAKAIIETGNLDNLAKLFASTGPLIESMGRVLGEVYGIFLSILVASAPIAQRYFDYLEDKLGAFDDYLKSVEGNKALVDFFQLAADAMADWGEILGNIFAAFGAIIQANLGPGSGGQYLLDWLKEVTGGWNDINDTVAGRDDLREFFLVTAVNAQKILSSLGALLGAFKDVSINPNLGIMFDKLAEGAPAFSEMLNKITDTGPAFAGLVVTLVDLFNILTDAETGIVFFDTLNAIVTGVRDFLATEFVTAILDFMAPISGFLLAIGAIGIALTTAGNIVAGFVALTLSKFGLLGAVGTAFKTITGASAIMSAGFGTAGNAALTARTKMAILSSSANPLVAAFGRIGTAALIMGGALKKAFLGPVGIIIGVIALLVGSFVYLYNSSDEFKSQMDAVFADLMALFSTVAGDILAAIQPLIPVLAGLFTTVINALVPVLIMLAEVFGQILTALAPLIPLLLGALLKAFVSILSAVLPVVVTLVEALIPAITGILEAVIPLISVLLDALIPVFLSIVEAILPLIPILIEALLPAFMGIIEVVLPLITMLADFLVPVIQFLAEVLAFLIPIIVEVVKVILDVLVAAITWLVEVITAFVTDWDGSWQQVGATVEDINNNVNDFLRTIWEGIIAFFVDTFTNLVNFFRDTFNTISAFISFVWNGIFNFFKGIILGIFNFFRDTFNNIYNTINTILGNVRAVFESVWNGIAGFLRGIVNGIIGTVEGMVNGVIRAINGLIGGLNGALSAVGGALGLNLSVGRIPLVNLPRLAEGGTVFPSRGGSIVNVAEAGRPERIEPLDDQGLSERDKAWAREFIAQSGATGAAITFQITQLPGESAEELAEKIARILMFKNRKGGATFA